jgi:stage V sporulation protein SpoVS
MSYAKNSKEETQRVGGGRLRKAVHAINIATMIDLQQPCMCQASERPA